MKCTSKNCLRFLGDTSKVSVFLRRGRPAFFLLKVKKLRVHAHAGYRPAATDARKRANQVCKSGLLSFVGKVGKLARFL